MKDIIVFDWETTGLTLHPDADVLKQPRGIEFGAAVLSPLTGEVLEELNLMINPGQSLEAIIVKITGITDAALAAEPAFSEVLPRIRALFERCGTMFAHNLPFDKAILRGELARIGVEDFPWPEKGYCTVGLYRDDWGRNPKMTELYEHVIGKPLAQTHRALDDVRALVEIIQHEKLWKFAR